MNDCFEYQGFRNTQGYGRLNRTYTHRLSWEMVNGPIPEGLCVLHKCDNPPCVNPDHLFLGTRADNMKDMWSKGRGRTVGASLPGEKHPMAIMTDAKVISMRSDRSNGVPLLELSERYGVAVPTVSMICSRKLWRHI